MSSSLAPSERKEIGAKFFLGIHIEIIGSRPKVIHIEGPQGFEVPRVDRNMLDFHEMRLYERPLPMRPGSDTDSAPQKVGKLRQVVTQVRTKLSVYLYWERL